MSDEFTVTELRLPLTSSRGPAVITLTAEVDEYGYVTGFSLQAVPNADSMKAAKAAYQLALRMAPTQSKS